MKRRTVNLTVCYFRRSCDVINSNLQKVKKNIQRRLFREEKNSAYFFDKNYYQKRNRGCKGKKSVSLT